MNYLQHIKIEISCGIFFSNEPNENEYQSEATDIHDDKIQKKKRTANKYSTNNYLQRKRQKRVDNREKSFYDFRLMIVDPPQKLDSEESSIIFISFGISRGNLSN